ncbi:MAG TPA: hypothetical protein VJR25_01475 [Microbacterium sp.]|uniref:hypothetical protein n=1 Tax=Microbacterium sp. TaxID=51671 RepID=UPI002B4A2E62|nr:hypothetical protein [Microbacterium sp.]HKT55417.1 hypothetical protein [Microbacterium sp.]
MSTFTSIEQHLTVLHSLLGDTSAAGVRTVMADMSDDDLATVLTEAAGVIRALEPVRRASASIVTERSLGRSHPGASYGLPTIVTS